MPRVDGEALPGVIELKANPETGAIVEVDGQIRTSWQPFHFDHCYNNELTRAGVLRSVVTPPEGRYTAFADGIQVYEALSPELRQAIEDKRVIYTLDLFYANQRFGIPRDFHQLQPMADNGLMEIARSIYLTTPKDDVKAFSHEPLHRPAGNIPYSKRSSSRDVPGVTPGNNHQVAGLLRPYTIEIFATRFLEDPDCPSVAPNIDDNHDSIFWRCCYFPLFRGCPSYCVITVATVRLKDQFSIYKNVYQALKYRTFSSHSSTSLSSVELSA